MSMLTDVTLRKSAIAYVYPENPQLRREENLQFYDRVTSSGVQVERFEVTGPELVLRRNPTPKTGGLEVRVGSFGTGPKLRLLVGQVVGSDPVTVTRETADIVWQAFRKVWGSKVSQPELTEVTLEFTLPAPGGNSTQFLADRVGRFRHEALGGLGREPQGVGFRFMCGPVIHVGSDGPSPPLPGAAIDLRIETLMEPSGSQLFVQAQTKWPMATFPADQLPPQVREQVDGPFLQLNKEARRPNYYLEQVYRFVSENVLAFLRQASG